MPSDDPSATAEELLAHSRWLKRLSRSLIADPAEADDLAQQTWVAAIEKPPAHRGNLRAWLGRVLRRRLYDRRRAERRRQAREVKARRPGGASPSPDDLLARAETRAQVAAAVLELTEPYRSTVLLRYFEEAKPRQIAALQSVPVSTVHTRLARGLDLLRARLRTEHGGDETAWRYALLPVAGFDPVTTPLFSLGSWIVATTTTRIALALTGLLFLLGLGFFGAGALLDDEDLPESALLEPARDAPARPGDAPDPAHLAGTAPPPTAPEAPRDPGPRGRIAEVGSPVAQGVVEGRVEDEKGRPVLSASALLSREQDGMVVARTRVGAGGAFRFEALEPGAYVISVFARGGTHARRAVRPGGPALVVTLDVADVPAVPGSESVREGEAVPTGVVSGTVLDDERRPLERADVVVWLGPRIVHRAYTDAEGRFHFAGVEEGAYAVGVFARGWAPVRHPVRPGEHHLEVTMDRGPSLGGVVVDARSGEPVAGMPITALGTTPGAQTGQTETAEDGSFRLGGLSPESSFLDVGYRFGHREGASAEYVAHRFGPFVAGTLDLRLELKRGLAIAGEVRRPDGTPWADGATVLAYPVAADGTVDYGGVLSAPAADNGTFRIPGLLPGTYDVIVRPAAGEDEAAAGGSLAHVRGVAAGRTDLVIELRAGVPLEGRLVDDAGEAVAGKGWVWVSPVGTGSGEPGSVAAEILEGGRFRTTPLDPGGTYHIRADGFTGYRIGTLTGVHPGDADVEVVLERGCRITGRVVFAKGQPAPPRVPVVAEATGDDVDRTGQTPGMYAKAETDPQGRFVLGGLEEGVRYALRAGGAYSGFVPVGEVVVVAAPATDVVVSTAHGVAFRGRLVDQAGEGIGGVVLTARPGAGGSAAHAITRPDGGFDFKGVPTGHIALFGTIGEDFLHLGKYEAPATEVAIEVER